MSDSITIDLFAEDVGHEGLLGPLVARIAKERGKTAVLRVRSARGGHGRAISEFKAYQNAVIQGIGGGLPDLMVVAIDANCRAFSAARKAVMDSVRPELQHICVAACPDPHIERWYLADLQAFHRVVGITPIVPKDKCERDFYKHILARAVTDAGHPPTLGGIEFARELAEAMDLFQAGRSDSSLKHFVDELTGKL